MQRALFVLMSAIVLVFTTARFAPLALAGADNGATAAASADPDPDKDTVDVSAKVSAPDIDVDSGDGGGAWYVNPVWVVVGLLAVGILVALIVAASRGGGTTVVK
jgi:hypothetical protein